VRLRKTYLLALILIGAAGSHGQMPTAPTPIVPASPLSAPTPQQPQAATPAAAAEAPRRIRVSGGVMEKNIVSKVQPAYPKDALAAGVSGTVVLIAYISAAGRIEKLEAISGPDSLRQAAIDAVQQWVYQPYLLNGIAVAVQTTVAINFNLSRQP